MGITFKEEQIEEMRCKYIIEDYSLKKLADYFNVKPGKMERILKYYEIKKRNYKYIEINDYIGKKYNNLTILKDMGNDAYGHKLIELECYCEDKTKFITRFRNILDGNTQSCGCYKNKLTSERNTKYNKYDLTKEYGIGYTSKNEEFYFDLEDYNKIKDYCWCKSGGYIISSNASMSRLIMNAKKGEIIDHIDNITTWDNRKSNLRITDKVGNGMNTKPRTKTGMKGINWNKKSKIWHCTIKKGTKNIYSKCFNKLTDAIRYKIKVEEEYFGEFRYKWEGDINLRELLKLEKELKNIDII